MKIWLSRATKVMIICLALLWNGQLLAETDEGLSKEYSDCIDKASQGATAEMFECNGQELDRQDARLNDAYKKLMSKLSPDRKKALLKAATGVDKVLRGEVRLLVRSTGRCRRTFEC